MDANEIHQVLTTLIDHFEAGDSESDTTAKADLSADSRYDDYWQPKIERFRKSAD